MRTVRSVRKGQLLLARQMPTLVMVVVVVVVVAVVVVVVVVVIVVRGRGVLQGGGCGVRMRGEGTEDVNARTT